MTVTAGVLSDFQAWLTTDASNLLSAVAAMYEQTYGIVNEQGSIDDPSSWVPAWSTLLDVDNCPTWALPYLSMFNGTGVQPGQADAAARAQIKYESPFKRGQGYGGSYDSSNGASGGAIVLAAQKYLTGSQSITLIERTNASGAADAYYFQIIVNSSELISADNLKAAVNDVKPGGVMWSLVATSSWTISELEAGYSTVSSVESTFPSITNLEGDVT